MAEVIESFNFLFLIIALFGAYSVIKWKFTRHLTEQNEKIILAWSLMFTAVGLNSAWFAWSRHTSGVETWNPAMYEWRWGAVMVTSLMFSWGMLAFIRHIEGFGYRKKLALFSVAFLAALGMGFY